MTTPERESNSGFEIIRGLPDFVEKDLNLFTVGKPTDHIGGCVEAKTERRTTAPCVRPIGCVVKELDNLKDLHGHLLNDLSSGPPGKTKAPFIGKGHA